MTKNLTAMVLWIGVSLKIAAVDGLGEPDWFLRFEDGEVVSSSSTYVKKGTGFTAGPDMHGTAGAALKLEDTALLQDFSNPFVFGTGDWAFYVELQTPTVDTGNWRSLIRGGTGPDGIKRADHFVMVQTGTDEVGVWDNSAPHNQKYHLAGFKISDLDDGWHTLVVVGTGGTMTFCVDGVQVGYIGDFQFDSNTVWVGSQKYGKNGGNFPWNGFLANLKVWNQDVTIPADVCAIEVEEARIPVPYNRGCQHGLLATLEGEVSCDTCNLYYDGRDKETYGNCVWVPEETGCFPMQAAVLREYEYVTECGSVERIPVADNGGCHEMGDVSCGTCNEYHDGRNEHMDQECVWVPKEGGCYAENEAIVQELEFVKECGDSETGFRVLSGHKYCQIDSNGCVTDGEGDYGNNENCVFAYYGFAVIYAAEWDIQNHANCNRDFIQTENDDGERTRYCGEEDTTEDDWCRDNLFLTESDCSDPRCTWDAFSDRCITPGYTTIVNGFKRFSWRTNGTVQKKGFKLCAKEW